MGVTGSAIVDAVGSWFAGDAGAAVATDALATEGSAAALGIPAADLAAGGAAADVAGGSAAALGLSEADFAAGGGGALAGDTAMGGAAGILGAADSSAASDALGLTAADVGAGSALAPAGGAADFSGAGGFGGGATGAGGMFLPVTGADVTGLSGGMAPLGGDMAAAFGMDSAPTMAADTTFADFSPDFTSDAFVSPDVTLPGAADGGMDAFMAPGGGMFDKFGNWVGAHLGTAGILGLDALTAFRHPQLPSAGKTAQGGATQEVTAAQGIIASGGTSSPQWSTMKASIDASINQEMAAAKAQLEQTAANNGMGGANSMVVQQQLQQMTTTAEAKRQELYAQALGQIVSQAVTMMANGDQTLGGIAQMQLQQSGEAQANASQIAEMALLLSEGGG